MTGGAEPQVFLSKIGRRERENAEHAHGILRPVIVVVILCFFLQAFNLSEYNAFMQVVDFQNSAPECKIGCGGSAQVPNQNNEKLLLGKICGKCVIRFPAVQPCQGFRSECMDWRLQPP